jgi:hypothetical protein
MDEKTVSAYKTLNYFGIICRCDDCDIYGCVDCVICKISDDDAIEIAEKLQKIANK